MNDVEKISEKEIIILIVETEDNLNAQLTAKKVAAQLGFDETSQALIATVVSELSTNILRYAGTGTVTLTKIKNGKKSGIEIRAEDKGPGIENVELAMKDSFTTTKDSLGLGLASIKRIMDEFSIVSIPDLGTCITALKWRPIDAH